MYETGTDTSPFRISVCIVICSPLSASTHVICSSPVISDSFLVMPLSITPKSHLVIIVVLSWEDPHFSSALIIIAHEKIMNS